MLKLRCEKIEPRSETEFDITFRFTDGTQLYEVARNGPFTVKVPDATGYVAGNDCEITLALVAPPGGEGTPAAARAEEDEEEHGPKRRHR